MKKLLFLLLSISLFACNNRKADPHETVIFEFLNKLKTEKVSADMLHSNYFAENKFEDEGAVNLYVQILSNMQKQLNESDEIDVMTYAEAQNRSIEVPTINDQNTDNVFVIKMGDRYTFCMMNGDKIESLMPLWKAI